MRKNVFFNTRRQMPSANIGRELKLKQKVTNCAGKAVSNGEFLYQPLSNGTIEVMDLNNIEFNKEINLKSFFDILQQKKDFGGMYLLLNENFLIIQIDEDVFLYDLLVDKLTHLLSESGVFVIYKSFLVKDRLFISSYKKEGVNDLYIFNVKSGKLAWRHVQNSLPKFVLCDVQKFFLTDDKNIVCRRITDGTVVWKKEVAGYGNYHDEVWESDEEGDITMYAVLIDKQLIVGVDKGQVISLNTKNGDINWRVTLNAESAGVSLIYQEGESSIYASANYLYEIDIKTGEVKRSYNIDQALGEQKLDLGHMGISDACLFIGTSKGTPALVVLDKSSFEIKASHPLDDNCELYGYPAVMGKYLTLMDFSKQLYIFEERENS